MTMRIFFLSLAMLAGLSAVSGCSSTGAGNAASDAAAINAMDNPPNSCGPGGSQNIEDCDSRR
ncbi:hypothetical protein [Kaistia geumhonensis]|uniref:Outer membrane protein assembly factor BamE (Lipoprotein component of BamABCDE complex) n=2 Tax=Kaistia geumhonensis TaxID=410839 RepID=A0ABU0M1Y4_9HYPH|nr:hypothetical protein [Kaistia geumhonensis]MDQ0514860.1 outer membrane protein assembly factor BamE (lipoprotein component of BamABCDE complex) [Kaistia geumhonensis]